MISHSGVSESKDTVNLGNTRCENKNALYEPDMVQTRTTISTMDESSQITQPGCREYWKNDFVLGICPTGLLFKSLIISQDFQVPPGETCLQKRGE